MEYVVDVQGFKLPKNKFVLKELSILSVNDDLKPFSVLFQPPCDWSCIPSKYKRVNRWLECNCHGISWNSGNLPYTIISTVLKSIFRDATKIYVKGLEKKNWLKKFVKRSTEIIDMLDLECPSLNTLREMSVVDDIKCTYHIHNNYFNCAIENVVLLKAWMFINQFC